MTSELPEIRGLRDLELDDRLFSALAHRTRRAIVVMIHAAGGELTSGEIARHLHEVRWQTVSGHLRILEEAGLLSVSLSGRQRIYHLHPERMTEAFNRWSTPYASRTDEVSSAGV